MSAKKKSFEESMVRLEQIVQIMENGEIGLEESMKLFQEGTALVQTCGKMLENAHMQVKTVMAGLNGLPEEAAFNDEL